MNQNTQNTSRAETSASDPLSIHQRAIAIDMHVDTVQRMLDEHVDIQQQLADGHFDAVRARAGNLDAQFFSIWVEPQLFGGGGARAKQRADDQIDAIRELAEATSRDVGAGKYRRRYPARCWRGKDSRSHGSRRWLRDR